MVPTLVPGQGVIAVRQRRCAAGQIRVFRHPETPSMWIVKRLDHRLDDGRWFVTPDNPAEGTGSERFGPVDLTDSWRVLFSIPLRLM